jgi:hypothetical protein
LRSKARTLAGSEKSAVFSRGDRQEGDTDRCRVSLVTALARNALDAAVDLAARLRYFGSSTEFPLEANAFQRKRPLYGHDPRRSYR